MDYFVSITEPRWANEEQTIISYGIQLEVDSEFKPGIVGVEDPTEWAQTLWGRFISGEWGPIADWDPEISNWNSIVVPPAPLQFVEPPIVTFVDGLPIE